MADNLNRPIKKLNSIAKKIIGCAFVVRNKLGVGFLKKEYKDDLIHELTTAWLREER